MFGFLRAVVRTIGLPFTLILALPVLFLAAWFGVEAYYYVHDRPLDIAAMQNKSGVDLADHAGSLADLTQLLGPPTERANGSGATNGEDYNYYHDNAVRVLAVGDTPVEVEFGASHKMRLLPYSRPMFPGAFFGLRIGDAPPTPAEAAALKARKSACCSGADLSWGVAGGKIATLRFDRSDYYYAPAPPSQGG